MSNTCVHMRSNGACPHCIGLCVCHGADGVVATNEAVWEFLEAQPGFNEALEQGRRDIAEGRGTPLREIRRER